MVINSLLRWRSKRELKCTTEQQWNGQLIIKGKNSSNENIDRMHTRTFSQPHSGGVVILCKTGFFFSIFYSISSLLLFTHKNNWIEKRTIYELKNDQQSRSSLFVWCLCAAFFYHTKSKKTKITKRSLRTRTTVGKRIQFTIWNR